MVNADFENGRACQQLETQIETIYIEILSTGSDEQRARLRDTLREAYKSYSGLAGKYGIPMWQFSNVSDTYDKAMGEHQAPKSTSVLQDGNVPF